MSKTVLSSVNIADLPKYIKFIHSNNEEIVPNGASKSRGNTTHKQFILDKKHPCFFLSSSTINQTGIYW